MVSNRFSNSIEYRKTCHYGNGDVLSRLPCGPDVEFDEGNMGADYVTVCTVKTISRQFDS